MAVNALMIGGAVAFGIAAHNGSISLVSALLGSAAVATIGTMISIKIPHQKHASTVSNPRGKEASDISREQPTLGLSQDFPEKLTYLEKLHTQETLLASQTRLR